MASPPYDSSFSDRLTGELKAGKNEKREKLNLSNSLNKVAEK